MPVIPVKRKVIQVKDMGRRFRAFVNAMAITHWKKYTLWWILFFSFIIRLFYLFLNYPLWWDSHVYIAIGKYIFSGGELGIWESFRPLLHPLLLGVFWKMGLSPILVGKTLDLIFSLTTIFLTYKIGEKIFNRSVAITAAIILSVTPPFVMLTGLILTNPLAMTLALLGIWIIVQKESQWHLFAGGFFLALSFLTRFPQGIWFGAVLITLLLPKLVAQKEEHREETEKRKFLDKVKQSMVLSAGFIIPIIPYLLFNYQLYNDPFRPFTDGSWIITTATWLYGSGIFFYAIYFFMSFPIYLFYLYYCYLFITKKQYVQKQRTLILMITALTLLYFLYVPRKEVRYLVEIAPLLALCSAAAIITIYTKIKQQKDAYLKPKGFIALCIIFLLIPIPVTLNIERMPTFEREIREILKTSKHTGIILSSDPSFVSFLDSRVVTLNGMEFAAKTYNTYQNNHRLLFVNDCDLLCELGNQSCEQEKWELLERMKQDDETVFEKTYFFKKKPHQCTYHIMIPRANVQKVQKS